MIVVTGGAGFIGSNLVRALNHLGRMDILVVDDLTDGRKFFNLVDAQIADLREPAEFLACFMRDAADLDVELVYHLGACSDTTEWNGRMMLETNYAYSKALLAACQARGIGFVYASSAAVYGTARTCVERPQYERPLTFMAIQSFYSINTCGANLTVRVRQLSACVISTSTVGTNNIRSVWRVWSTTSINSSRSIIRCAYSMRRMA